MLICLSLSLLYVFCHDRFVKPISVELAIGKLDGFTMSGDVKIKVEPASFTQESNENAAETTGEGAESAGGAEAESGADGAESGAGASEAKVCDDSDFDVQGVPLFRPLPLECKAALHPTCVLRNVYTADDVSGASLEYDIISALHIPSHTLSLSFRLM